MICKKCNTKGVKNYANNIPFWYCKICKEEIFEEKESINIDDLSFDELSDFEKENIFRKLKNFFDDMEYEDPVDFWSNGD